jgi:post-segregation antitoxin (ccd killing protein)
MTMSRTSLAVAVLCFAPSPVHAAVRQCGDNVSSEVATAATERDAKKKAIDQWREKAAKLGAGFDSWRLAYKKSLECSANGANFDCVAVGRPCIIKQAPKSPPKLPGGKD